MLCRLLLMLTVMVVVVSCSGCATILGAIIGHQSGELLAGAAIGAGVDIASNLSGKHKQNCEKEAGQFEVDSSTGMIRMPKNAACQGPEGQIQKLGRKFDKNNWTYTIEQKRLNIGDTELEETWLCTTAENLEFKLTFTQKKNQKLEIRVEKPKSDPSKQGPITSRIYQWLQEKPDQPSDKSSSVRKASCSPSS